MDAPTGELRQRSDTERHVPQSSLYTRLSQRRSMPLTLIGGLAATAAYAYYRRFGD